MPAREKKRPLRPRTPSRVKKRTTKKKRRARAGTPASRADRARPRRARPLPRIAALPRLGRRRRRREGRAGAARLARLCRLRRAGGPRRRRRADALPQRAPRTSPRSASGSVCSLRADDDARLGPRRLRRRTARRRDRDAARLDRLAARRPDGAARRRPAAHRRLVRRDPAPLGHATSAARTSAAAAARLERPDRPERWPRRSIAASALALHEPPVDVVHDYPDVISEGCPQLRDIAVSAPARPGRADGRAGDALRCAASPRANTCCPTAAC